MKTTRKHFQSSRYEYDFGECNYKSGYAQADTDQDAHYFGQWVNPATMTYVTYTEGDHCRMIAETKEEFIELLRRIVEWDGFKHFDCFQMPDTRAAFESLGFGKYCV